VTIVEEPAAVVRAHESVRERANVWAYRALGVLARALPERTGRAIFTRVGRLAYRVAPRARAVVAANQAQVLGRPAGDPLVQASTRDAFGLYGRFWVDAFHLTELSDDDVLARVTCDTVDRLRAADAAGKGAILALPHMGNWDAAGRWMTALGMPITSVAEELEPRRLFELFLDHRRALGLDIVGLSEANVGRQLARALGANRMVALVADRDFGGRGVEVEMFGKVRRLPAGPALLSLTTGAPLMVTPTYTTKDGWRIHIGEPLTIEPTGDRRSDVRALTEAMGRAFEAAISAAPSDWHLFQPGWER
jgi:phosphatidylinositol dimannoside acyltransferase